MVGSEAGFITQVTRVRYDAFQGRRVVVTVTLTVAKDGKMEEYHIKDFKLDESG